MRLHVKHSFSYVEEVTVSCPTPFLFFLIPLFFCAPHLFLVLEVWPSKAPLMD